jgi:hypothetical protein
MCVGQRIEKRRQERVKLAREEAARFLKSSLFIKQKQRQERVKWAREEAAGFSQKFSFH